MTMGQRKQGKTPSERRALDAAETALEASGLRYQSGQIPGLAHVFVVFAEAEIKRLARETPATETPDAARG